MKNPFLNPKRLFLSLSPLLIGGKKKPFIKVNGLDEDLLKVLTFLLENQLGYSRVEQINLENVFTTYQLLDLIEVSIGTHGNGFYYVVKEPEFKEDIINHVVRELSNRLVSGSNIIPHVDDVLKNKKLDPIGYFYFKLVSGFGPLTPLILDPYIEDIHLSSYSRRIYIVHGKFSWVGWLKTNIVVEPELVDRLVLSISRRIGKHVSLVQPLAEGSVDGVLRLSLTYGSQISPLGSSIVLRKRSRNAYTITKLIDEGVLTSVLAAYLWLVIEHKGWIVIAGHVGSGKTTLLQALLGLIPRNRKVISIEDSPEISITSKLWDSLIESSEAYSRTPQVDSFNLLKFALRRRSDYIVIGEVRGVEARLLVQASRLGHGVINTIHADSAQSVLERLIAPPISIPRNLLNNIWTIILMEHAGKARRVVDAREVSNDVSLVEICSEHQECTPRGIAEHSIRLTRFYTREELYQEIVERAAFLERLVSNGVFTPEALADSISAYYVDGGFSLEHAVAKEAIK